MDVWSSHEPRRHAAANPSAVPVTRAKKVSRETEHCGYRQRLFNDVVDAAIAVLDRFSEIGIGVPRHVPGVVGGKADGAGHKAHVLFPARLVETVTRS
jgi:hypothetical protein